MAGRESGWRRVPGRLAIRDVLGMWALLVWMATPVARAQVRARPMAYAGVDAAGMATTLPAALRAMSAQAAVVFVGTVTSVRRVEGDGFSAVGVIEVRFAVEQGIRGVSGGSYLLREWGGLWPPGERGFVVGDRRLMLLHRPGATGLSSPVGGYEGAIPVVATGARVRATSRGTAAAEPMLDLRWIAARLVRSRMVAEASGVDASGGSVRGSRLEPEGEMTPAMREMAPTGSQMASVGRGARTPTLVHGTVSPAAVEGTALAGTAVTGDGGSAGSTLPVASVVALLRQWQMSENAAR